MKYLFLSFSLFLFGLIFIPQAQAQSAPLLNAGVLDNIWYSAMDIKDGDNIRIYGGIQNHSTTGFSGNAVFYIDEKVGTSIKFISNPDSLIEVRDSWKAVAGEHKIKLKIVNVTSLIASTTVSVDSLLSPENQEVTLSVSKPLTLEAVKGKAVDIAEKVVEKIDSLAIDLSKKIDAYKKPEPNTKKDEVKKEGKSNAGSGMVANVFESVLSLFGLFIEHWKITLGGIAGLFILGKIWNWIRGN